MEKGFTVENWKLKVLRYPLEDAYSINKGIIAVADGITRDPFPELPGKNSPASKLNFFFKYPRPSPARKAADIFCNVFPEAILDFIKKDEYAVRKAFTEANDRIRSWNLKNIPEIDYVTNDFAGCVAAGAFETKGMLYWGYITDCGAAVFDDKGILKFRTENEGPDRYSEEIKQKDKRLENALWGNPETRKIIRKEYRNKPDEKYAYGALTGEETAMKYVRTGAWELKPTDYLAVYSDGLEKTVFSEEFSEKLKNNDVKGIKKLCKENVQYEGTLVISKKD